MIFPIGDDQVKGGHFPFFSYLFIAINCVVFLFQVMMPPEALHTFINEYGAIPKLITQNQNLYSLITCQFLHGGWMHLIGNMMFLWVFADNIEATIGRFKFVLFYLAGGIIASMVHIYFNPVSPIPTIGASGAISAVLGAYFILFRRSQIKVTIFLISNIHVSALIFLGLWFIQQLLSNFSAGTEAANVAWWAHIGGFVFGVIAGVILKAMYPTRQLYKNDNTYRT